MIHLREPFKILAHRYIKIINEKYTDQDEYKHRIKTMLEIGLAEIDNWPIDKLYRWLGFVQGILTIKELINVDEEREFSRPLFHEAYKKEQIEIPRTINIKENTYGRNTTDSTC